MSERPWLPAARVTVLIVEVILGVLFVTGVIVVFLLPPGRDLRVRRRCDDPDDRRITGDRCPTRPRREHRSCSSPVSLI